MLITSLLVSMIIASRSTNDYPTYVQLAGVIVTPIKPTNAMYEELEAEHIWVHMSEGTHTW